MSTSAIPAAANAALSSTITQLHGHGHKRGLQLDSLTNPSSSPASQTPTRSTQQLFSNLLSSVEQVAGIRLPQLAQSSQPLAPNAAASPSATGASGSKLNVTA